MHCGAPAAGPCASCHEPVCGNCCTLTEGGTKVWAICLDCDWRGGRTLKFAWRGFLLWLLAIVAVMALVAVVIGWLEARI